MKQQGNFRLWRWLQGALIYVVLAFFALVMLFPFLVMVSTSLKVPADSFSYPPRLLPRDPTTAVVAGYAEPLPLYSIEVNGVKKPMALAEKDVPFGLYAAPDNLSQEYERPLADIQPANQTATVAGETKDLWQVDVAGQTVPMVLVRKTVKGRFINPQNPAESAYGNVRLSEPVTAVTWHPENFAEVATLSGVSRSLTNTILVTVLVVAGQIITSVMGGYAFARLRFPGRNNLFMLYLGTIMIPFVVLIIPLYQLMVLFGWVDKIASLIIPWVFTAYGTFMMRQFFITIPKEIEEAALIDGASRIEILRRIFIPASVPALATQATFSFLYAWNSFIWPLLIINTGNEKNHVLTLTLSILRGRAVEAPNIILAAAAISVLPPLIVFIFAQRYYVESVTSSGVKG